MKSTLFLIPILLFSFLSYTQNVNIPDANFKAILVGNTSINTNGDTEIQVSEAVSYTGAILASNQFITDVTGLEAFINLTAFVAENNMINQVDLSLLTSLVGIRLTNNQLTNIDVSNLPNLRYLIIRGNPITSLDLSNNPILDTLYADNMQLTTLDVRNNTLLTFLWVYNNQLTSLNTTGLTILVELLAYDNQLTQLNLSTNTSLRFARVSNNNLNRLGIANGNNGSLTSFLTRFNPNLKCIQIDRGFQIPVTFNWRKDAQASYSEFCRTTISGGGHTIAGLRLFPNPANNNINIESDTQIQHVEIFSIEGEKVLEANMSNTINLTRLDKGFYFANVTDIKGNFEKVKFFKE